MRKNGFTLIELLAVIVILAIIALIATPIILGIINDAREKANERSVELYASAVRNGIAAHQLRTGNEVKLGQYTSETLPFNVEYDGEIYCYTVDIYGDNKIYIDGCKVNEIDVDYVYGSRQDIPIVKGKLNSICKLVKGDGLSAGSKYDCKVDPNKDSITFYVLNTPKENSTTIDLIMNINIGKDGEGVVSWSGEYDTEGLCNFGGNGPITAMNYLETETQNWTNLNLMIINTFEFCDSNKNCTTKAMSKEYNVYARMPYLNELNIYDWKTGSYAYLYDNLNADCYDAEDNGVSCDEAININGVHVKGMTHISGVQGYLTLSSNGSNSIGDCGFWGATYGGIVESTGDDGYPLFGVRPVITLDI